jgi:hypothetical protein
MKKAGDQMGGGYTKKEILDAVVKALRPLSSEGGGYTRQLEAVSLEDGPPDVLSGSLRLPAILVSFSSSTYSPGQYAYLRENIGFEITVVLTAGYGRGPEEVLDDIRTTLAGSNLGLDTGPVTPLRETPVLSGAHRVACTALYSVTQHVPLVG